MRIRHTAVGLNFIDCYQRSGLYPMDLPLTLGTEAAGVIEAVGPGVEGLAIGQRVAYAGGQMGSYAELLGHRYLLYSSRTPCTLNKIDPHRTE